MDLCIPYVGVEELLVNLVPKVKTGLITNAYDSVEQRKRLHHAGLQHHFDVIVIAGEFGLRKPEPAIFLHTLEQLNVAPENALYVGDSIEHDIIGSKKAGMETVLIDHKLKPESAIADHCVQGIEELQTLLGSLLM